MRPGDLLCEMDHQVGRPHRDRAVEHADDENKAIWISQLSSPLFPHERRRGVGWATSVPWHGCTYDDGDEDAGNDEEDARGADKRHESVSVAHNQCSHPDHDSICHEDHPGLALKIRVINPVQVHPQVCHDDARRCTAEDPAQKIPVAGIVANQATPFVAWCHRRPVVAASGGRNGGPKFGDAGGNDPVEDRNGDAVGCMLV